MHAEFDKTSAEYFRLSVESVARMRKRGRISLNLALSYFFNHDSAFRRAARKGVYDDIKDCLRIILYPIVVARRKLRSM